MTQKDKKISMHYLIEVRTRIIYCLILLFIILSGLLYFSNNLYDCLAEPLVRFLPNGHLIATGIVSPFFVPFKLAFFVAIMMIMPFIIFQVWRFIAPALYPSEKKFIWSFMFLSVALFYIGILFAYFVIFPALFHFLANIAPKNVILSPDISEYLDFTTKLLLIFGLLFEIPIAIVALVWWNLIERRWFIKMRSYAILIAFILGMFIAPPDVFSQTLIALPIWFLYELGIFLARLAPKRQPSRLG